MSSVQFINYLGYVAILPTFIIAIFIKTKDLSIKIFKFYTIICFLLGSILNYMASNGINNLLYFNIYNVIELFFLTLFYIQIIELKTSKLFYFFYSLVIIGYAFFVLSVNSFSHMDMKAWSVSNIIIIIFASIFLIKNMIQDYQSLYKRELLIISGSALVYYGGTIMLFLMISFINPGDSMMTVQLWQINYILGIISNTGIAIALWGIYKKTKLTKI